MKKKNLILVSAAAIATLSLGIVAFAAGITSAKAEAIALEHASVTQADVAHIFTEIDYDHSQKIYDVEFITNDLKEYDYEISAADGAILGFDYDAERSFYDHEYEHYQHRHGSSGKFSAASDDSLGYREYRRSDDRSYKNVYADAAVSEDEAISTALEKAGLKRSELDFIKIELDHDDGRLLYEGEMVSGIWEYEFEVCAESGRLLDWDVEHIYD